MPRRRVPTKKVKTKNLSHQGRGRARLGGANFVKRHISSQATKVAKAGRRPGKTFDHGKGGFKKRQRPGRKIKIWEKARGKGPREGFEPNECKSAERPRRRGGDRTAGESQC